MTDADNFYRYAEREAAFCRAIAVLEGTTLLRAFVQVVEPEFNVVYLVTDAGVFAIQGQIGGELLDIVAGAEEPDVGKMSDNSWVAPVAEWEKFLGRKVSQARAIGRTWNGHGIEVSFVGLSNRTLIVQSIEAGSRPKDLSDCLRLGIGTYRLCEWRSDRTRTS